MRVACSSVGGPSGCPFIAEGSSADEVTQSLTDHINIMHNDIKMRMDSMSDQEKSEWMAMMRSKIES